ncbi:hypothetical protein MVEN_01647000 [Mycena venus]|uniref:DUF6535 domain-containing protein n=1 Tax=Mycena venus TaxID=2733690 RepID=A0A8H6XN82_9AGAR|nr:hypothetical protein MVEN_01647000 [Mycena venus]
MPPSPTTSGHPGETPLTAEAPAPSVLPADAIAAGHAKPSETSYTGSSGENENVINQQAASLRTVLESVRKAVEGLKQQPPSPDKKIAFWTAYKKLADEFDRELQAKYGQDLDTSLIFAGLFSAVTSAFIIQIQPELQPDPNAPTQALLALLVQNITGLPTSLLPLAASASRPTVPPPAVVVAQSLLYFGLFSTLLAALLAVLGKQWLLHYNSVGERGTIAERGVERQKKFDGMRRWKFDLVMQVFPLLLQFSLLLFSTALSIYLWTIHYAIAAIVFSLTGLGLVLYAVMIMSAVVAPDSPFQTSVGFLLKMILNRSPIPEWWDGFGRTSWKFLNPTLERTWTLFSGCWMVFKSVVTPPLPLHNFGDPLSAKPVPIFNPPGPTSKEVSAVVWALETSTDPAVVETAAELVPELQWPVNPDVRPALKRLDDSFRSCIDYRDVRDGMTNHATACIRAFWVLDMVTDDQRAPNLWTCNWSRLYNASRELDSIQFWTSPPWDLQHVVPEMTPWVLLDASPENKSIFSDLLFCLGSCFFRTVARDRSVFDKSNYSRLLIPLLFENLVKRLTDANPLDHSIGNAIVIKVAQIADRVSFKAAWPGTRYTNAGYRFCALPGASHEARASTLRLLRVDPLWGLMPQSLPADIDTTWLSETLESVGSSSLIGDLWQALFFLPSARDTLSVHSIRILMSALSTDVDDTIFDDDREAARHAYYACAVLDSVDHWFVDDELRQILQQNAVWANLARGGGNNHFYTNLGEKLSKEPEWKRIISENLPGWLDQWPTILEFQFTQERRSKFWSVLSRLWDADETEADEFGDEGTIVMIFSALANAWNRLQLTHWDAMQIRHHINLLHSTVSAAFSARIPLDHVHIPSQRFRDTIIVRLGEAMAQAGHRLEDKWAGDSSTELYLKDIISGLSDLVQRFASTILGELRTPMQAHTATEWRHWYDLQEIWLQDVR